MTISYPVSVPNQADIAEMTLVMENRVGISESPFTFEQQVFQHQGQRWGITVTLNPLSRLRAAEWRAWLTSLMGAYGTFLMGDPLGVQPSGSGGGTPKVRVGSQSGNALDIYAASTSVNSWLLPGDYLQVGSQSTAHFHRVLSRVTTNASGAALIDVWPRVRSFPTSGSSVFVQSTVGLWRLVPDSQAEVLITPNNVQLSFSAKEAL
jgi:hypothetical protein